MTVERGFGWLEDDPAVVEREIEERGAEPMLAAPRVLAAATVLNYASLLESIPDQRNTSSCVGQAFATAMYLTARIGGYRIPRPSAKLIYDFARMEDQRDVDLRDDGSRPLAAVRALAEKGMVADADWPLLFHPEGMTNVNARPPLDVYQQALGFRLGDYYRIAPGAGAALLLRAALERGFCPVFAMPVDDAYLGWDSDATYEGRKGAIRGWHMQAIAGYGDGHLLVPGSWGAGWAGAGTIAIDESYIDGGECRDFLVPTVVPHIA